MCKVNLKNDKFSKISGYESAKLCTKVTNAMLMYMKNVQNSMTTIDNFLIWIGHCKNFQKFCTKKVEFPNEIINHGSELSN